MGGNKGYKYQKLGTNKKAVPNSNFKYGSKSNQDSKSNSFFNNTTTTNPFFNTFFSNRQPGVSLDGIFSEIFEVSIWELANNEW